MLSVKIHQSLYMKLVKNFPKFQEHLLVMSTSILQQNSQEAAVTICFAKFGCSSQVSLPRFEGHLFLITAFNVYHRYREHEEGSSKFGGVEGALVNVWGSMEGETP